MATSNEHGVKAGVKEKFFRGLAIASDLITVGGPALLLAAPFFTDIDLGVLLMSTTAAFELGGAVLGTFDFQIAKNSTSNTGFRTAPQGVQLPSFPPIPYPGDMISSPGSC